MEKYCYDIYIGVNDKDDKICHHTFDELKNTFKKFSNDSSLPFSAQFSQGGYIHKNGDYVNEDALHIIVVDNIEENRIIRFCNETKKMFNQESILVVRRKLDQQYY